MWSYRCVERGLSARDHRAPRGAQTPHGPLAARYLLLMSLTRDDIRESVERAGDEHWDALRRHHEDAYPNPKPTPGDVCKGEAERLNQLGLGDAPDFELLETRVERVGDDVRITHGLRHEPSDTQLLTAQLQELWMKTT